MLTRLKIKNLALIKDITLDFKQGFNLLMGETGAGKSIILDAVNFALGSKADKSLISYGEQVMKVEACFEDYNKQVCDKLSELDIEDEGLVVISRSLTAEGKSDIKVNGNTVTLSMLKSLTTFLADSYSQHENLLLLKEKNHLNILDAFSGDILDDDKQQLKKLLSERTEILNQIKSLGGDEESRARELDFLKYQIDEIEEVNPSEEEENSLKERLNILSSAEKITVALQQAYTCLNQNISALNQIKTAEKNLSSISNISQSFSELEERLTNSFYEVQDIAYSINDELENVSYDERELEKIDARLDKYKDLKRKYGADIKAVLNKHNQLIEKYQLLLNCDETVAKFNNDLSKIESKIDKLCESLHNKRKQAATVLETGLKREFADLGMKNARFEVEFNKISFSLNGYDDIKFMFSANLGEELKPLSKIISGGEMSRFMLAFKNLNVKQSSTMIFDEIDTGISGDIGSAVAKKLANISKYNQVLCISHLPQVCVMADNYFYVSKSVVEEKTVSNVQEIASDKIDKYIARLTGGNDEITNEALAHAKKLLEWANEYKNSL